MGAPKPIHVFISYAHADEALKDELLKHLTSLRRSGAVALWHDRDLAPGEPPSRIEAELDRADVVLLLLSADYLASDDLHDREMMRAIRRHEGGTAKVVAVLLRPITIEQDAPFADFASLPSGRKPVASWPSRDEAWSDVVRGLRRALGLPAGDETDPDSSRTGETDEASAARVEIAKSRDRMIIVVTAIVAVTIIFVRTSGAPTPYITAVIGLACVGAAGSVLRHARRSKKLAVLGAGAVAGAAVMGTSGGASAATASTGGSLISSLVNATAVGIAAAAAGVGIGLGVEGSVAAVDKLVMPPSVAPRLNPPFDGISSLLAADAGADAGGEDAGAADAGAAADDAGALDEDAGTTLLDAGLDASTKVPPDQPGSVDQATFNKNAASAVAAAEREAMACLRPGVACSGRVSFTPDGYVGAQSIACAFSDGKVDAAITRCVLPIFKKRRIPPLHQPTTSAGASVKVALSR